MDVEAPKPLTEHDQGISGSVTTDRGRRMGMVGRIMEGMCGDDGMSGMMTKCLISTVPEMPEAERRRFVLDTVSALLRAASADMTEEQKGAFIREAIEAASA